jgi:hypothetical protein
MNDYWNDAADEFVGLDEGLGFLGAAKCPVYQKNQGGTCVNKTCTGNKVLDFNTGKCIKPGTSPLESTTGCDDGSYPGANGLCADGTAPVQTAAQVAAIQAASAPQPACPAGNIYDAATQMCEPINPVTGQIMVQQTPLTATGVLTPAGLVDSGAGAPPPKKTSHTLLYVGIAVAVAAGAYFWYKHNQASKKGKKK